MKGKRNKTSRRGAALLVVLLIVMAITILSLGFLSRSDVELACGQNMVLKAQMDYLADSGLEHARGLILYPQDVDSEYWAGDVRQQLVAGSGDYYDVEVVRDDSNYCNYQITCNAYRESNGEEIGRSGLRAELRLDPGIAFWTDTDMTIYQRITLNGDVYCSGELTNEGVVNGDVFANSLSGPIAGQQKAVEDLLLSWPQVTVADFTSRYPVQPIGSSLSGATYGPYDPVKVCYNGGGDVQLTGNVQINGMLVVEGDLVIRGEGNVVTAAKNLPALLVTRDLIIEDNGELDIVGLAVVEGQAQISAGAGDVSIVGGLFVRDGVVETAADSSGNANHCALYGGPVWQPSGGQASGALEFDGVDDVLDDPDAGSYLNGLSAVTVSLWVKSDVTNVDRGILFTRVPTGDDEELGIRYDRSGAFGGGARVIKASIRSSWSYTQIESTSNVQTTEWQHLGLVWKSGSSLKLSINGQLNPLTYDSGAVSGVVSGVQKLMLGRGTKGWYWDGLIDDARIYNCALDPNDIYPPTDGLPGLLGHWKLDEDGSSNISITAAPSKTAIVIWPTGVPENWGSADSAFFRSIERN